MNPHFIILACIGMLIGWLIAFVLVSIFEHRMKTFKYLEKISYLEIFVTETAVNKTSMKYILDEFSEIHCVNMNRKRTSELYERFRKKFKRYLKNDDGVIQIKKIA